MTEVKERILKVWAQLAYTYIFFFLNLKSQTVQISVLWYIQHWSHLFWNVLPILSEDSAPDENLAEYWRGICQKQTYGKTFLL